MAFRIFNPAASSGAGYDDQNNNGDGYYEDRGNTEGFGGTGEPSFVAIRHSLNTECS
jgi:hypothetical protein